MVEEANPFALATDEEVFRMRETDRRRRAEERERDRRLPVWQKTTACALTGRAAQLRDLVGEEEEALVKADAAGAGGAAGGGGTGGGASGRPTLPGPERRQEKENMSEFIAKKREMFLVQMSLDTKREEIRKLEEKAQHKEEALQRSEQMLEEDAMRFDTFLKENDKKAHDAIKRAEEETKRKQDKIQEIKRLSQRIQMVSSDMSKHREALEDCLRYKEFLDSLTPAMDDTASDSKADDVSGAGESEDTEETVRMYFTDPQQLLDIFADLEEQNLFLIQNSQEAEHTLEELNQTCLNTQREKEEKTRVLQQNIQELKDQIAEEEAKVEQLQKRMCHGVESGSEAEGAGGQAKQEMLLNQLNSKVTQVYEQCGFDASTNPSTLFMLSQLESKLERLLSAVNRMPESYVIKAEKEKERRRREKKREEQQALQAKMQEERNKRSMERSMQAPNKRTGRQVMFRSQPVRRAIRRDTDQDNAEDLDEMKYLADDTRLI